MLIAALTPQLVRDTYLRGIDLGAAWRGAGGDAAIMMLLGVQVSHAEAIMGIHFARTRVMTAPDGTMTPGTDYDLLGALIPYERPTPDMTHYHLTLRYHDVQAVTRVRLWEGYDTAVPPNPVYTTLPLAGMTFSSYGEVLAIPVEAVTTMDTARAWAVDYLIGLGQLPVEVVEWCALGAAIEVLSLGGSAADVSHGLARESLDMDGIREDVHYGTGANWQGGGVYAGPITVLRNRRDDIDLTRLRFRYQNTLGERVTVPPDAVIPQQPYEQLVCTPLPQIP